jgi:hypothetical protein
MIITNLGARRGVVKRLPLCEEGGVRYSMNTKTSGFTKVIFAVGNQAQSLETLQKRIIMYAITPFI